jgi:putative flippase GtrA
MTSIFRKYRATLWQFIKFGIVGFSNTLISYVIYSILVYFGVDYLIGNIVGFIVSVLNSFYWNNKYVFKNNAENKISVLKVLIKVFVSYGFTGLILNSILLVIWVDIIGISEYLAPVLNLIITIPINFLLNKLWAFKGESKVDQGE